MNIPLVSFFFDWNDKDIAILLMFLAILFILWFFGGIWIVGLGGLGIFILGLFLIIKPSKSR